MRKSELQELLPGSGGRASSRPRVQDAEVVQEQADVAASGGPTGAAGVLALQRTAGNAAVTQALGTHRHDHRDETPVQRALDNDVRNYGTAPGALMQPRAQDQQRLEAVFPKAGDDFQEFPDPVVLGTAIAGPLDRILQKIKKDEPERELEPAPWVKAINPQRDSDRAYRRNCVDASRSFLASWSGNPTVAVGVVGTTDQHLEQGATDRTATWLATRWKTDDIEGLDGRPTEDVWARVATRLANQGHGASAVVVFQRAGSANVHAVCGVNSHGRVIWVDPQMGRISVVGPLYEGTSFMTITLSPQFTPVAAPPPQPTAITL